MCRDTCSETSTPNVWKQEAYGQADWEQQRSNQADQPRSILLIPWRRVNGERKSTSLSELCKSTAHHTLCEEVTYEAQQRACQQGVEEKLVQSHGGFFGPNSRDELGGLLRGECVHGQDFV